MFRLTFRHSTIPPVLALAGVSLALAGCSEAPADPRTGPPLVRVTSVADGGQADRAFTGTVSARVQSDLGFRVPGKIVPTFPSNWLSVRFLRLLGNEWLARLVAF